MIMEKLAARKHLWAAGRAVLLGFTVAGFPSATEQPPDEMIVAMASF